MTDGWYETVLGVWELRLFHDNGYRVAVKHREGIEPWTCQFEGKSYSHIQALPGHNDYSHWDRQDLANSGVRCQGCDCMLPATMRADPYCSKPCYDMCALEAAAARTRRLQDPTQWSRILEPML